MERQQIQIYLKHHNDPDGRFSPKTKSCADFDRKGVVQKGCGGPVTRYVTYPKEKGMYFDGPPEVAEQFPIRQDGAVIALVYTDNVHFATCPMRPKAAKPAEPVDHRALAAGK